MRAPDLANYFGKKIAKPVAHTYVGPHPVYPTERNYVVAPAAVQDYILHALVALKSVTGERGRLNIKKHRVICGEVEVIFKEDDSISDVLAMAVAISDNQLDLRFLRPGDPIRLAYNVAERGVRSLPTSRCGCGCRQADSFKF
jgi:hypothetical protein